MPTPQIPSAPFAEQIPKGEMERRQPLVIAGDSPRGLAAVIGLIFITDADKPSGVYSMKDTLRSERPKGENLVTESINKVVLEGRIAAGATANTEILRAFNIKMSSEEAVELIVRDDLRVGYSDPRLVPYRQLAAVWKYASSQEAFRGKRLLFVESVTQTSMVSRSFRKMTDQAEGTGVVFRAGANMYLSAGTFQHTGITWVDAFDLANLGVLLATPEGSEGAATSVEVRRSSRFLRRAVSDEMSLRLEEAEDLLQVLRTMSLEGASRALGNAMVVVSDIESPFFFVTETTQDDSNRCWAAVASMLLSWQEGEHVSPAVAAARGGAEFGELYRKNLALEREAKERFIKAIGLQSSPVTPMTPAGLQAALARYGPLWITSAEVGAHALLVVGILGAPDGEASTVTFVDPVDGQRHTEKFSTFLREYYRPSAVEKDLVCVHCPELTIRFSDGSQLPVHRR